MNLLLFQASEKSNDTPHRKPPSIFVADEVNTSLFLYFLFWYSKHIFQMETRIISNRIFFSVF